MSKLLVCNFKYVWCCETLPKLTRYYTWNYIYPLHKFFNLSSTIYLITNVKLKSFWVVSSLSTFVGHTSTQELFGLLCSAEVWSQSIPCNKSTSILHQSHGPSYNVVQCHWRKHTKCKYPLCNVDETKTIQMKYKLWHTSWGLKNSTHRGRMMHICVRQIGRHLFT